MILTPILLADTAWSATLPAELKLSSQVADTFRAGQIKGIAQLETDGGNITVGEAGGVLTVRTGGGQIDFRGIACWFPPRPAAAESDIFFCWPDGSGNQRQ